MLINSISTLQFKRIMYNCQILVLVLLQLLLNLPIVKNECVFINDCPDALKYINNRRHDSETINILKNAHCGYGNTESNRLPKVFCDRIPAFPDLPEGCIKVFDCPAARKLIETRKHDPEVKQLLKSLTCGDSVRKDMIFCNKITSQGTVNKIDLLPKPNKCGIENPNSKILLGKMTELDEFPWVALIKYKSSNGAIRYRCHGTLINNKYIVTAAHCLSSVPYSVVLGEYNIITKKDCIQFQQFGEDCADPIQEFLIDSYNVHPKFGSEGALNDIGLVRLSGTVSFSDFVKPICLPLAALTLKRGEPLWITGWGKTENRTMSNVKLKARIFYLTKEDCSNRIQYTPDDTQTCAGSANGADTCNGDSGGPLMVQRVVNGDPKTFLAGVVSYGLTCGTWAAIYTNVSIYKDWILETIQQ